MYCICCWMFSFFFMPIFQSMTTLKYCWIFIFCWDYSSHSSSLIWIWKQTNINRVHCRKPIVIWTLFVASTKLSYLQIEQTHLRHLLYIFISKICEALPHWYELINIFYQFMLPLCALKIRMLNMWMFRIQIYLIH